MRPFWSLLLLLLTLPCSAAEWESLPNIQAAVESFLQEKLASQPGERTFTVSRIDPRLKLAKCDRMDAYLPSGGRLWGNSSIGVRCLAPTNWSMYVPVIIKVTSPVLVTLRPIASGQAIQPEDVQIQQRDITPFAGSALTAVEQAADRTAVAPIAAGAILRTELLRASQVIRQGQQVKLIAQGAGFRVTSDGQAMGNAMVGQVVTVKTRSGQLIKGIARSEGVVEVYF